MEKSTSAILFVEGIHIRLGGIKLKQAAVPGYGTGRYMVEMTKRLRAIHRARHGFINDS